MMHCCIAPNLPGECTAGDCTKLVGSYIELNCDSAADCADGSVCGGVWDAANSAYESVSCMPAGSCIPHGTPDCYELCDLTNPICSAGLQCSKSTELGAPHGYCH